MFYCYYSKVQVDFVKFLNAYSVFVVADEKSKNKKIVIDDALRNYTYNSTSKATPLPLIKHNDKVFQNLQIYSSYNKIPFYMSENYRLISKIIELNTKKGLKNKSIKIFNNAMRYIYGLFDNFDNVLAQDTPSYSVFYNFSKTFEDEFYKPDFFIRYIYASLELLFLIKRIKPKKKTKKKKNQTKTMVSYLSQKSRYSITIRVINAYLNRFNERSGDKRIGDSILYLAFSGKNSFLYKKKILMYNKLLEKKKFY